MSVAIETRRVLEGDWYSGTIPENVRIDESAYIETSYSFLLYRSELAEGVRIGHGSSVYLGSMFDVGRRGQVRVGNYALVHGAWFICDSEIEVGDYALISWNVVLMDSYGVPLDPAERRLRAAAAAFTPERRVARTARGRPIRIGRNVWIGFDCIVMPGVTIGDGSIIGARSVVTADVPPLTVAAGNPARVIRSIERDEVKQTN